jgi:hypothetical protein
MSGFLGNDNFSTIKWLADLFIQDTEHKNEFHVELEVTSRYMK